MSSISTESASAQPALSRFESFSRLCFRFMIVLLVALLLIPEVPVSAQGRRSREPDEESSREGVRFGRGPGGGRGGRGRGGFFGGGGFLRRFDANEDGRIEPSEVPERMQPFWERMAERMGLDPDEPVDLDRLEEGFRGRRDRGERGDDERESREREGRQNRRGENSDDAAKEKVAVRLPTDFGNPIGALRVPPGFGEPNSTNVLILGNGAKATAKNPTGSGSGTGRAAEFLENARNMLGRYDADKNGQLSRQEWEGFRWGNLGSGDRNRDGVLTLEELARWLARRAEGGDAEESSISNRDSATATRSRNRPGESRGSNRAARLRFRSPQDKWPSSIPDWFARRDRDGDGQVRMSEWTNRWTAESVEEFLEHDKNGDGVITPQETF